MSHCLGKTSDGQRCHRDTSQRIGDHPDFCWQHQTQQKSQSGGKYGLKKRRSQCGGGLDEPEQIDLGYGRGQYWVMGRSRKTQAMDKVILSEPISYQFEIPMMNSTEMITLRGPVTLGSLLMMIQSEYQEHGVGRGRGSSSYIDLAGGDTIKGLTRIGSHVYEVIIK